MLSLSIDFYVRVFVRVYTGAEAVKEMPTKLAYIWQSQGCDSFYLQHVGRKVPPWPPSPAPCRANSPPLPCPLDDPPPPALLIFLTNCHADCSLHAWKNPCTAHYVSEHIG